MRDDDQHRGGDVDFFGEIESDVPLVFKLILGRLSQLLP